MGERFPSTAAMDAFVDALVALGLEPHVVQAFDPAHPRFDAQRPLLVLRQQFAAARPLIADRYPLDGQTRVVQQGEVQSVDVSAIVSGALDVDRAAAWLLPALPPERDVRSLAGLRGVMERLYAPGGCPWDREQTHESLRGYFLEECYEFVDAIDRGDLVGMREELGDVLAHVFMQTALAQQAQEFTLEDVAAHAAAKFVRRHPHVFGDEVAGSHEALLARWAEIKEAERAERAVTAEQPVEGALDSVPRAAPALQRAQAMVHRARRTGPDLADLVGPGDPAAAAAAFTRAPGDETAAALLWAVVAAAEEADVNAEEVLRLTANTFAERFGRHEHARHEPGPR